jgi:glycosyltransferase involved in cell wall biosynthesis
MEIDGVDVRFRLGAAPPRLRALAAARLAGLGLGDADELGPPPAVVAEIDPRVVVDIADLRRAASAAVAARSATAHPARGFAGTPARVGVTLVPRDVAEPARPADETLGRWLPEPDPCVIPSGPTRAVVHGFFTGATGYALVGRNLVAGLAARGVPVAARTTWWMEPDSAGLPAAELALLEAAQERPDDPTLPGVLLRPAGDAYGNPSLSEFAEMRLKGATCAYTMFESDDLPGHWLRVLREFDQVWVPSRFNVETFAAAGLPGELLRRVPIGIDAPTWSPDGPRLTLPNRRRTAFLSVFDWNERKGPDVLLRAWAQAFGPDDDVVLYLRTGTSSVGAVGGPREQVRALGLDPGRLAPIELITENLPVAAYAALFRSVDAFVLTSRGEAFCVPLLEALAAGLPAIGTGYGGSADFLDETTGFPIPARLVPVTPSLAHRVPYYACQRWADPSVDATAAALRGIVDDPTTAATRAAFGFARAHLEFDRRVTGEVAERALAEATPPRTVRSAGRSLLVGPLLAESASGKAARGLFDALERSGATPRVAITGARDADLDPIQTRHLRRAARLEPVPGEATIAVDALRPGLRAVLLTSAPTDVRALDGVERIWTTDARIAATLRERGVAPARITVLPPPVDVTLWTPDRRNVVRAQRTVYLAPEPAQFEALVAFMRLVRPPDDVVLVFSPLRDRPLVAAEMEANLKRAAEGAGVEPWVSQVVSLPDADSRHASQAVATMTLALAADPAHPLHELARACGVPVVATTDLAHARLLLDDQAAHDAEAVRTRRAAVARAREAAAAVRVAFDEVAALSPLERRVRPLRIAVVLAPQVAEPARVFAGLRATAMHEIVGVDGDLRGLDYVARVSGGIETVPSWDETLINALEAHGVAVAEGMEWNSFEGGAPYPFEDATEKGSSARNCDAGSHAPLARGPLQLVRAVDATATGPAWRAIAVAVRTLRATEAASQH